MNFITKSKVDVVIKINTLLENGRKEITTIKQLKKFPIGSLISYMNLSDYFKIGGFLLEVFPDSFSFIDLDFKIRYRVDINKISKIWVGSVFQVTNDYVSILPTTQSPTNFPVVIANITVFYAKNTYAFKRYTLTQKYQTAMLWVQRFHKPTTTNKQPSLNA